MFFQTNQYTHADFKKDQASRNQLGFLKLNHKRTTVTTKQDQYRLLKNVNASVAK